MAANTLPSRLLTTALSPAATPGYSAALLLLIKHGAWLDDPLLPHFAQYLTDDPDRGIASVDWGLLSPVMRHPSHTFSDAPATESDLAVLRIVIALATDLLRFATLDAHHHEAVLDALSRAVTNVA
jgi:hypothetical protein